MADRYPALVWVRISGYGQHGPRADFAAFDSVLQAKGGGMSGGGRDPVFARGYTAEQFAQTASDAAGFDLKPLLHTLIATTSEIDYTEMLDWFGLRFIPNADPAKTWTLEVRPDATAAQTAHFAAFMAHSKAN